jgi:hypothetical protein
MDTNKHELGAEETTADDTDGAKRVGVLGHVDAIKQRQVAALQSVFLPAINYQL